MFTLFDNLRNDRQYLSTTGLSKADFEQLLSPFTEALAEAQALQANKLSSKILDTPAKKLFFLLYYLKTYPSLDVLGLSFQMESSGAAKQLKALTPILRSTLQKRGLLPRRIFESVKEMEAAFGELENLCLDATEINIQRPVNQEKQKRHYSGKKKDIRSRLRS